MNIITNNIPYYASPLSLETYIKTDLALLPYSRLLCLLSDTDIGVEYASVHLIIPARIPLQILEILPSCRSNIPPYICIATPLMAHLRYTKAFPYSRMKVLCLPISVNTWKAVPDMLNQQHFSTLMQLADSKRLKNRSQKYMKQAMKDAFSILTMSNTEPHTTLPIIKEAVSLLLTTSTNRS